ncbi:MULTISPECIES: ABC transporter permease [unclassified Streptomyces]|uniref:ABC transporter permease n=1 Tax=unclassified Streptomyces TaxID=2593676 RepID=UPI0022B681E9|nr:MULTISPECIES: ABC transporter permease subunit [unclassified Streptomyces]MCZ7417609.1 ABC transporter permease subunit [Streptomyces sp. WMMC897]MCZ7432581.1 ABC transporter permease subunit [Streptomyces sp. WMMC1477]
MQTEHPHRPGGTQHAATAHAASIHDIGYRNYEGARLGRSYARRSLFAQSLRGAYGLGRSAKSKITPMILFGIMCAPALIVVAVAITTDLNDLPVDYREYAGYLSAVIGLYLAAMAPQSVSRDLRFHTVPLYFSRPIERIDYVLAKYAAMASALLVFTAAPLLILYVGALLGKLDFGEQTADLALGLVSVAVLSVLYAGVGLVIAALTPRRGFGVAAIIGVLTVPYFAVTTLQFIADSRNNADAVGWLGLASPGTLVSGFQAKFLGAPSDFPGAVVPSHAAGACYLLLVLALVAGSYAVLMARYRKAGL